MKILIAIILLLPGITLAGPMILELNVLQGEVKKIKNMTAEFEASNGICSEGGVTPLPWTARKTKKVPVKILEQNRNTLIVEVPTKLDQSGFCNYKFKDFVLWYNSYGVKIKRLDKTVTYDFAKKLELTGNPNALFAVDCKSHPNLSITCVKTVDGKEIGYKNMNVAEFYLDLKKTHSLPEVRATFDLKFK